MLDEPQDDLLTFYVIRFFQDVYDSHMFPELYGPGKSYHSRDEKRIDKGTFVGQSKASVDFQNARFWGSEKKAQQYVKNVMYRTGQYAEIVAVKVTPPSWD